MIQVFARKDCKNGVVNFSYFNCLEWPNHCDINKQLYHFGTGNFANNVNMWFDDKWTSTRVKIVDIVVDDKYVIFKKILISFKFELRVILQSNRDK